MEASIIILSIRSDDNDLSIAVLLYRIVSDGMFKDHHSKIRSIFKVFEDKYRNLSRILNDQVNNFDPIKLEINHESRSE